MNRSHPVTLAVPPQPTDHARGPVQAPVVVVEYGDFECPSCKVAAATPQLLVNRFAGSVRFIFRHFPLTAAHPHAEHAAEAAECAAAQGKFWEMYDRLFQNQEHLEDHDLERYAGEVGLEMRRFVAEMTQRRYLPKVRESAQGGERSHIRATPTFFINGVLQDISYGMQALHDAVATLVRPPNA